MKKKDIFQKRKNRKDEIKKRKRNTKFRVVIRFVATREFEIMAENERDAILDALNKLRLIEPKDAQTISAVISSQYGTKVYDHHFKDMISNDFEEL